MHLKSSPSSRLPSSLLSVFHAFPLSFFFLESMTSWCSNTGVAISLAIFSHWDKKPVFCPRAPCVHLKGVNGEVGTASYSSVLHIEPRLPACELLYLQPRHFPKKLMPRKYK